MKYVRSIQLAFSAFALLLFAIPVSAGDQVPLNGTFSGEVTLVTPLSAEVLLLQVSLSGISTHLGRFKGEAEIFQNIADGSYSGTFIWTAPNGATVSGTFVGQLIPTATLGLFENIETITITSGTGRFAGASGVASAGGHLDQTTSSFVFPFAGSISSAGSNKAP